MCIQGTFSILQRMSLVSSMNENRLSTFKDTAYCRVGEFNHSPTHPTLHLRPHTNLGYLPKGLRDYHSHPEYFRNCCRPMYSVVSTERQSSDVRWAFHNM